VRVRSAPPAESKPEAANFPSHQYEFSSDHKLFNPPTYAEPPKDMWYEIPNERPKTQHKPNPIFPWEREDHERPAATRVFAEDLPTPPPTTLNTKEVEHESPMQPRSDDGFEPFSAQVNAWDSVPSISRYVQAVKDAQTRRMVGGAAADILSPSGRRESLILTDFPSSDSHPSLPVTPAPIPTTTFWGPERDIDGDLPAAEGVPPQSEWVCPRCGFFSANPIAFYRALRRTSSTASTAISRPQLPQSRPPSFDIFPPLPPHLRTRKSSSNASAFSTATTIAPSLATADAKEFTFPLAVTEMQETPQPVVDEAINDSAPAMSLSFPSARPQQTLSAALS
jgi:glycogenin glucosyltransferase